MIVQDFTTDRSRILSALNSVKAGGNNDFVEHLLNPLTGLLNVAKQGRHKRVAVLYTDAWWDRLPAEELQRCIDTCARYDIEFYAVIYTRPEVELQGIKASLRLLAEATGGDMFDGVTSKEAARAIAIRLQQQSQGSLPCEVTWQSSISCDDEARNLSLAWQEKEWSTSYLPPHSAVARLQFVPPTLRFLSKPVGQQSDTMITVTAVNSDFAVSAITSSNAAYRITPQSFLLADGESRQLTVSFTPADSNYSWTEFKIENDRCATTLYASGYYPGVIGVESDLLLERPNGGEVWIAGSDTVISWRGVSFTDSVELEYSTNNGDTWRLVERKATGGYHKWQVPATPSTQCLMQVKQRTFDMDDGWVVGADGAVSGNAIAVDDSGNVYVTGTFTGSWVKFKGGWAICSSQ